MGKHIHKLSNIDMISLEANCQCCGRVKIKLKGSVKRPRCSNSIRENRGKKGPTRQPYGLTDKEAKAFRLGRACEICGVRTRLNVDHCHTNGHIRGVLCSACNMGIGHFKDNAELLLKAIEYLQTRKPRGINQ